MSMSNEDRAAIDQLFGRLADTERRSQPRDAEAEAFIRDHVGRQPGAPYFMAQTIVMQDYALKDAERRIADLEAKLASSDPPGSLNPSGFGAPPERAAPQLVSQGRPWSQPQPALAAGSWPQNVAPQTAPQVSPFRGGGFLAGAAQTAMGVAGGVLLGNAIGSMFGGLGGLGGDRVVAEPTVVNEDVFVKDDQTSTADAAPDDDGGGFFDSFFGGGDDTV